MYDFLHAPFELTAQIPATFLYAFTPVDVRLGGAPPQPMESIHLQQSGLHRLHQVVVYATAHMLQEVARTRNAAEQ